MNWDELKQQIDSLTPEQRKQNVAVYDASKTEFYTVIYGGIKVNTHSDLLKKNCPFVVIVS